jgi:transcription antitermination factor NusG
MFRDIIKKLEMLSEAPVKPGERKNISFRLNRLEKLNSELKTYKNSLSSMKYVTMPATLQKEIDELQTKLQSEIDKVQAAYQELENKAKVNDTPVKMENLFKALAKNCKQIIKVYKQLNRNNFDQEIFLYRGIKSTEDALYGKPFENRKPKDSLTNLHDLVNNALKDSGFVATRENSTFVTGKRSQAAGYGDDLYIIFPVDGFEFTYTKEGDLILDRTYKDNILDKNIAREIKELIMLEKANKPDFPNHPNYNSLFSQGNFDGDVLTVKQLIKNGFIPESTTELLDKLITTETIVDYLQPKNTDIYNAITSQKEIYLTGPYYAINSKYIQKLIDFLIKVDASQVKLPEQFGEYENKIQQGDVVRILAGEHKGKLATVYKAYNDSKEITASISHNKWAKPIDLNMSDVELYTLPDGTTPSFQKGEKVIVSDKDSDNYGFVGTVSYIFSGATEFTIRDEYGNENTLYKSEVSKYTPELEEKIKKEIGDKKEKEPETPNTTDQPTDIKVGDKVNVLGGPYAGNTGTVAEWNQYNTHPYKVKMDFNDKIYGYKKTELEKITDTQPTTTFKIGDKVEIISGLYKGEKAIVLLALSDSSTLKLTNGNKISAYNSELKLLPDLQNSTQLKFPIGSKVKVTNSSLSYYGKIGTVTKFDGVVYIVTFDDGLTRRYFDNELEKANLQKTNNPPQIFEVGDRVEVTSEFPSLLGKQGKVMAVNSQFGFISVHLDGTRTLLSFPITALTKIDEVQPPKPQEFHIGDMVQVTNGSLSSYGTKGKVTDMDVSVLVIQDSESGEVFFAKKSSVKKIG